MEIDDMAFFHEGTVRICGTLDINEMLESCFYFLKQFIPIESISMAIYEPEISAIRILSWVSDIKALPPLDQPIFLSAS